MYYSNNELPPQRGWICPKCGRVNAPWMPTCGCVLSQTSGISYTFDTSSLCKDKPQTERSEDLVEDDKCFDCEEFFDCDEHRTDCPWK